MRPIFVFAGNYGEYRFWLNENKMPPNMALYITDPMMIAGFTNGYFAKVGTWYIHKWAEEAIARLKAKGFMEYKEISNG